MKTGTLLKLPRGLQKATAIGQKAWCGLYTSVTCPTYFFVMLLCQRVQGFLFFLMSATKMNTHNLYEFCEFSVEVVLKSIKAVATLCKRLRLHTLKATFQTYQHFLGPAEMLLKKPRGRALNAADLKAEHEGKSKVCYCRLKH